MNEEPKKVLSDQYTVDWNETDIHGNAKISAICNYLQLSAGNQAMEMGFGFFDVEKLNQVWVIIGLMVKMVRFPKWLETIKVETWPKGIDRIVAFRDFKILDKNDNVIGAATSSWMILDKTSRRPQKVDVLQDKLHLALKQDILDQNPPLIKTPDNLNPAYTHKTQYSEIDHNGHVNNTRYVDWTMNAFSIDHHKKHHIDTFLINFLSEARINEEISISANALTGMDNTIQGTRLGDGKPVFRAIAKWK